MFDSQAYFPSFMQEMQGYLATLRRDVTALASPTRWGEAMPVRVADLARLGHTIAGLAGTLDISDIALLGETLEEVLRPIADAGGEIPQALVGPITRFMFHLESRVKMMQGEGTYLKPDTYDMREAERIATTLRPTIPPVVPDLPPPVAHETASSAMNGVTSMSREVSSPADADETIADPLTLDAFPSDIQAVISAFFSGTLSHEVSEPSSPTTPPQEAVHIFLVELEDDLTLMRPVLVRLQGRQSSPDDLRVLAEIAHKLRGAAYTVQLFITGAIGDMLEDVLKLLRQGHALLDEQTVLWLIACVDAFDEIRGVIAANGTDDAAIDRLATLHEGHARILIAAQEEEPVTLPRAPVLTTSDEPGPPTLTMGVVRQTVRVESRRLDLLMNAINTILISNIEIERLRKLGVVGEKEMQRAIDRVIDLYDRLRAERIATVSGRRHITDPTQPAIMPPRKSPLPPLLAQWLDRHPTTEAPTAEPSLREQLEFERFSEFDLLMAMVGEVITDMRSLHLSIQTALNQIGRQAEHQSALTESVQRDVLALRLVPLDEIVPRLQLALRTAAAEEGKEATLIVDGADCEIDRDISDALVEPLVQLIRNAIAHGIETPEERADAGKKEPPEVRLRAINAGDEVIIEITDNGRGVNPQRIAAVAMVTHGLNGPVITADQARAITREQAHELMFHPDLSTATVLRPTAGRGMGLPAVKRAIEGLRGSITVTSAPGKGTAFRLRFPASLGVMRALMIEAGATSYAVPMMTIWRIAKVKPETITTDESGIARAAIDDGVSQEHILPIMTLADLFGRPEMDVHGADALIFKVANEEYAVLVDRLGDERDIVVRRVPLLLRNRGVRGATITPQGDALLILDLPEIIAYSVATGKFGERMPVIAAPQPEVEQGDHILIVDDSPSIRRGLEMTLTEAGYAVAVARDGADAIEQMTIRIPRLLILDVEMPQLNGYDLLEVLRTHGPFTHVPAIMLTSRAAPRYRDHAMRLGAIDYLVKPTSAVELLDAVTRALAKSAVPITSHKDGPLS